MDTCFICGDGPHAPRELHNYWSTLDASVEFARQDREMRGSIPSMTAVETLDPREAVYA